MSPSQIGSRELQVGARVFASAIRGLRPVSLVDLGPEVESIRNNKRQVALVTCRSYAP
jgi:hypothetical protein